MNDMNQLARIAENLGIVPLEMPYQDAVMECVALLFDSLDTYGKRLEGSTVDAWRVVLQTRGATTYEIQVATRVWCTGGEGKKLPTPGEFAQWIIDRRAFAVTKDDLEATRLAIEAEERERVRRLNERLEARYGDSSIETVRAHAKKHLGLLGLHDEASVC